MIASLVNGEELEPRHRRHRLSGRFGRAWECHVTPDWLLVWEEDEETIVLIDTGSHADLFG